MEDKYLWPEEIGGEVALLNQVIIEINDFLKKIEL